MLVSAFTYYWYTSGFLRATKGVLTMFLLFALPWMLAIEYGDELSRVISPTNAIMLYIVTLGSSIFLIIWIGNRYKITNCFIGTASYKNQELRIVNNKRNKEFVFRFEDIQQMAGKLGTENENDFPHFRKLKITHNSGVSTHYIYVYPFDGFSLKNPKNIPILEFENLNSDWGIYQFEKRENSRV